MTSRCIWRRRGLVRHGQDPTGKTAGQIIPFGAPGRRQVSLPVPGDYDGSGHVELAVYIPAFRGQFYYRPYAGKGN